MPVALDLEEDIWVKAIEFEAAIRPFFTTSLLLPTVPTV